MEVEVMPPTRRRHHAPAPGILGAVVATATMLAAVGVGLAALFGRAFIVAVTITLLWPVVFSPAFTRWVFGPQGLPFWKALLIVLVAGTFFNSLRRKSWQKK